MPWPVAFQKKKKKERKMFTHFLNVIIFGAL